MLGNLGEKWDKDRMLLSNWLLYIYLRRLLLVMSLFPNRDHPVPGDISPRTYPTTRRFLVVARSGAQYS